MHDQFKVSIIIPCYNDGNFLPDVLGSIVPETMQYPTEVLVVNDGSTNEETLEILDGITIEHPHVRVLHKPNGGLSSARNFGVSKSIGEFILPLDSDDLLEPDFVNAAAKHLIDHPDSDIVFGNRRHFQDEDKVWIANYDPIQQVYVNQLPATAMYRRTTFEKIGGYDESMKLGYEDWEFWLHAMSKGCRFHKLEMISYHYRIRKESMVRSVTVQHHDQITRYIRIKHLDFVTTNYIGLRRELYEVKNNYRVQLLLLFKLLLRKIGR